jgi:hypothetical protein
MTVEFQLNVYLVAKMPPNKSLERTRSRSSAKLNRRRARRSA